MSKHHPYPNEKDMIVRVMVGDPVANAWLWLEAYLENINSMIDSDEGEHVTMDELINTALSHVDETNGWGGDYISRGGAFEGMSVEPMFWEKLAVLKEKPSIAQVQHGHFFSCAC